MTAIKMKTMKGRKEGKRGEEQKGARKGWKEGQYLEKQRFFIHWRCLSKGDSALTMGWLT